MPYSPPCANMASNILSYKSQAVLSVFGLTLMVNCFSRIVI